MTAFTGEFLGTTVLVLLGDGVVANVVLNNTKGNNGGLISITMGWAAAVFTGVFISSTASGAHLNPTVTIALAYAGKFSWALVPQYIAAQMLGAMLGAVLVWLAYKQHFDATSDPNAKLGTFCTIPSIRNAGFNFTTEVIGSFVLLIGALCMAKTDTGLGAVSALPIALLVLGIGLSLGGPTGYAINPARDLGPRIIHALLPIKGKRDSDWGYSWIPVVAPIIGGLIAAMVYGLVN